MQSVQATAHLVNLFVSSNKQLKGQPVWSFLLGRWREKDVGFETRAPEFKSRFNTLLYLHRFWAWVWILTLPLISCVTLGKLPTFLCLTLFFIKVGMLPGVDVGLGSLWGLSELLHVKHLDCIGICYWHYLLLIKLPCSYVLNLTF